MTLDDAIAWAESVDMTVIPPRVLIDLSLAGIEARHWFHDDDAELDDDMLVDDLAAALVLGARADVELLKRGILDGYLLRHRNDGEAARRLTKKVAQKLPEAERDQIEAIECDDWHVVDSVVACQLIETTNEIVSPDPVQAYLDAGLGQRHVLVRATVNDVIDQGRKLLVRQIETEAIDEDTLEVEAVEDEQPDPSAHPFRAAVENAIAKLKSRKRRLTKANVASELGISRQHFHRLTK